MQVGSGHNEALGPRKRFRAEPYFLQENVTVVVVVVIARKEFGPCPGLRVRGLPTSIAGLGGHSQAGDGLPQKASSGTQPSIGHHIMILTALCGYSV